MKCVEEIMAAIESLPETEFRRLQDWFLEKDRQLWEKVVLDTNIFVGGGFNKNCHSAEIVQSVRDGRLVLVWDAPTRGETKKIISQIPPLDWKKFADLFQDENEFKGRTDEAKFAHVEDPADRKFAALADATGAILISNDDHLLNTRQQATVRIYTPGEFIAWWKGENE